MIENKKDDWALQDGDLDESAAAGDRLEKQAADAVADAPQYSEAEQEAFKAAPTAAEAAAALAELPEVDEPPIGGEVVEEGFIESPATRREREAAEGRLPEFFEAVRKDHEDVVMSGGQVKMRKYNVLAIARDVCGRLGMKFLSLPGQEKDDDDFRKGGKFLMKKDGTWGVPDLTQLLTDILHVTGTTTAIGIGSQLKALKARLAESLHAGTLASADAVIPTELRAGAGALLPMVLDATGRAVSLAAGSCGAWAEQQDGQPLLRRLKVAHDPDAACPEWDEKIRWAMQNRAGTRTAAEVEDRVKYLEELLAAALYTGKHGNEFQQWAFFQGTGGNFKGGCLDAVLDGIYEDSSAAFGRRLKASSFFKNKYSGDEKVGELQTLEGSWLAVVGEAEDDKEWKESVMKDATGSSRLTVRPMGRPERSIINTWFLIAQGNVMPKSSGNNAWTRRRHVLIFDNKVEKKDQDPKLAGRLVKEAPGIFNRLLAALERIYENGGKLVEPESVEKTREEFEQAESHIVGRFAKERLVPKDDAVLPAKDVFAAFKDYKVKDEEKDEDLLDDQKNGEKKYEMKFETFRTRLRERLGFSSVRQNPRGRAWELLGYELADADAADDAPPPADDGTPW